MSTYDEEIEEIIKPLLKTNKKMAQKITQQQEELNTYRSYIVGILAVNGEMTISIDDVQAVLKGRAAWFEAVPNGRVQTFRLTFKDH